jgi:hypothetical protein
VATRSDGEFEQCRQSGPTELNELQNEYGLRKGSISRVMHARSSATVKMVVGMDVAGGQS